MKFSKAIVRTPCDLLQKGLTSVNLGTVDFEKALSQHQDYVKALETCGLEIIRLEADNRFPDSVFVEDVAVVTDQFAVLTNPGAPSRNAEKELIKELLTDLFGTIESINPPGTLEGGDIMMAGNHFYIGLSERTNREGADQLLRILAKYSKSGIVIPIQGMLHLKTGISYLENNKLLTYGSFQGHPLLSHFDQINIPYDEAYAANSLWINGSVLVPAHHPSTSIKIRSLDYTVIELEMSEFQKLDGGLSCLSLRF